MKLHLAKTYASFFDTDLPVTSFDQQNEVETLSLPAEARSQAALQFPPRLLEHACWGDPDAWQKSAQKPTL